MKKNKRIKNCIIIALLCIILGSVLIGVGVAKGGNIRNFTFNRSFRWFPMFDYKEYREDEQRVILTDEIKNIKVDVDVASIEIKRGSSNMLIIKNIKKQYVKVNQKTSDASIHIKHEFMIANGDDGKIIIQLKDNLYESMQIQSDVGSIDIEDIRAKKFIVNASLGKVKMDDIYSENLNIKQNSGDVKVNGVLLGHNSIDNELGKIDVRINGKQQDYRYKVHANLGTTRVQDMKKSGSGTIEGGNQNTNNYVELSCSLGDVELRFK